MRLETTMGERLLITGAMTVSEKGITTSIIIATLCFLILGLLNGF